MTADDLRLHAVALVWWRHMRPLADPNLPDTEAFDAARLFYEMLDAALAHQPATAQSYEPSDAEIAAAKQVLLNAGPANLNCQNEYTIVQVLIAAAKARSGA